MTGPAEPEPDPAGSDGVRGGAEPGTPPPAVAAGQRPPHVLMAAVLGFVAALYLLLNGLVFVVAIQVLGAGGAVGGLVFLSIAAADVWGAVRAVTGRGGTVLRIGGWATAGVGALGSVLALTQGGFSVYSLGLLAVGVGIVLLLGRAVSQQYFAARGAR